MVQKHLNCYVDGDEIMLCTKPQIAVKVTIKIKRKCSNLFEKVTLMRRNGTGFLIYAWRNAMKCERVNVGGTKRESKKHTDTTFSGSLLLPLKRQQWQTIFPRIHSNRLGSDQLFTHSLFVDTVFFFKIW